MKELRDWYTFVDNKSIEPHFHLTGEVYNDETLKYNDGEIIMTSRVISIVDGIATTKSGNQYKLGLCGRFGR